MNAESLTSRIDRVVEAIEYVEMHLLEAPRVEAIAAACGLSRTHLQRLFSEVLGESVGGYLRRRRLCHALNQLISTDRRVLDIAVETGFLSQEAFTRAFTSHFGEPPAVFRRQGDRFSERLDPRLTRTRLQLRLSPDCGAPRIESRGPRLFVGIESPFILGMSDGSDVRDVVPDAWRRFESEANSLGVGRRFGLTYLAREEHVKRGDEMLFMAGMEVPEVPAAIPQGFAVLHAPASDYAVFRHPGPPDEFAETVMYAFLDWRPTARYEFHHLAVQLRSFASGRDGCDEYWMPVLPKGSLPPWREGEGTSTEIRDADAS